MVFRFERIRGFRVDLIECLHELEDLGVEHAVNLVESECFFFPFLGRPGRSGGLDCGGDRGLVLLSTPHKPPHAFHVSRL